MGKTMWLKTTTCEADKWSTCRKQDDDGTKSYKFALVDDKFTLKRYKDDKCTKHQEDADKEIVFKDVVNFNRLGKQLCAETSKDDVFAKLAQKCGSIEKQTTTTTTTTTKKATTTTTTTKKGATTKAVTAKGVTTAKGATTKQTGTTKKNGTNTTEADAAAATRVLTAIATVFTALIVSAS